MPFVKKTKHGDTFSLCPCKLELMFFLVRGYVFHVGNFSRRESKLKIDLPSGKNILRCRNQVVSPRLKGKGDWWKHHHTCWKKLDQEVTWTPKRDMSHSFFRWWWCSYHHHHYHHQHHHHQHHHHSENSAGHVIFAYIRHYALLMRNYRLHLILAYSLWFCTESIADKLLNECLPLNVQNCEVSNICRINL